jgi:hypothetical protein
MNLTYTVTDETQGKRIIYSCPCFPSSIDPKTFILLLIALLLPQYSALLYPAASRGENKPYKYTTLSSRTSKNLFIFFHSFYLFPEALLYLHQRIREPFLTSAVVLAQYYRLLVIVKS